MTLTWKRHGDDWIAGSWRIEKVWAPGARGYGWYVTAPIDGGYYDTLTEAKQDCERAAERVADTIRVSVRDYVDVPGEADGMADVRAAMIEGREIRPETAVAIASWWQSPGSVGHDLAGFASGSEMIREDVLDDIAATLPEARNQSDRDALDRLASFVRSYGKAGE